MNIFTPLPVGATTIQASFYNVIICKLKSKSAVFSAIFVWKMALRDEANQPYSIYKNHGYVLVLLKHVIFHYFK